MNSNSPLSSRKDTQAPTVELNKHSSEFASQIYSIGAMGCLILFMAIWIGVARNQWHAMPFAAFIIGIGASMEAVSKWLERKHATKYRLSADWIQIGDLQLSHQDIASIGWPEKSENKKANVIIQARFESESGVHESNREPPETLLDWEITLNHLKAEDRLLMIHYLQQIETQQKDWDKFSCRYLESWISQASTKLLPDWIDEALERHPFWASFVCAPYMCAIFLSMVSQYVYWAMGASIAISAVVNVRMLHGAWLSPIGETLLGFAGILILIGIVSACFPNAKSRRCVDESELATGYLSLVVLFLAIILGPLATQLFLLAGFKTLAMITMQLSPWLPCVPFVVHNCRKAKEKKDNFDEHVARANLRWQTHLESFYDDSSSEIHSGSFSTGKPTTVDSRPATMCTQSSPSW